MWRIYFKKSINNRSIVDRPKVDQKSIESGRQLAESRKFLIYIPTTLSRDYAMKHQIEIVL